MALWPVAPLLAMPTSSLQITAHKDPSLSLAWRTLLLPELQLYCTYVYHEYAAEAQTIQTIRNLDHGWSYFCAPLP